MTKTMTPQKRALRINLPTMDETVAHLAADAEAGRGFTLFTLNLDHLVKIKSDSPFADAYGGATYVTADGWPVVWLARRKGARLERTTGADLVEPLCREAAHQGLPVYFFGSSPKALQGAADHLRGRYPGLQIVGMESPPYGFDPTSSGADAAIDRMIAAKARLVFIALGAPKQELFAARALARSGDIGFLCIGAALDFLAGHQQRAPKLMQRTGTEWLYRLISQPRRLGARYAKSALVFFELAARHVLKRPHPQLDLSVEDLKS